MIIHGLNKLTLLDFPGLTACTVFTGGCNFRCPFCHNGSLVLAPDGQPVIPEEEVFGYLEKRKGILEGVCVTGGEPTLNADLIDFLKKVKAMGYKTKLDTNGTNPDMLIRAVEENAVDYVAMDIKNSREKYPQTVGIPGFDTAPVEESVRLLANSGVDHEFRTTFVRELHTAAAVEAMGQWLQGAPRYFLQNFADSGNLIQEGWHGFTALELQGFADIARPFFSQVELRGID